MEVATPTAADRGGRVTPFAVLSCIVAATGGLLFGYDLGISGGVTSMEPFLNKFFPDVLADMRAAAGSNYCIFDSQRLTSFTSSLYLAGLAATLVAAPVTRLFGRRTSILVGGATFVAGAALAGLADNIGMLISGRALLGVGIGFTNQAVPLYLSETAPPRHRGALNNAFEVFIGLGVLVANLVNYGTGKLRTDLGWRLSLLLGAAPAVFLTVGALFLSDTPNSILQRTGDASKAAAALKKLRGGADADVQGELLDIAAAAANATSEKNPLRALLLERRRRPQLVMAVALPLFAQLTGINVITFYAPVIFRTLGLGEDSALLSTVLTGAFGTGTVFVAVVLADRAGRRTLFVAGGIVMLVAHVSVGVILATELGDHGSVGRAGGVVVLVMVSAFVSGFGISWGPLGWLVPSEILPLEVRSVGQSVVVAVGFLFAFALAQTLLALLCHLKYGVFFLFAGLVLAMTGFVVALLPETKGLPIETVETVWQHHWFWKGIVGPPSDGGKAAAAPPASQP